MTSQSARCNRTSESNGDVLCKTYMVRRSAACDEHAGATVFGVRDQGASALRTATAALLRSISSASA
jgi:hypothetical protein